MGLCIEVGILADLRERDEEGCSHYRQMFRALNDLLAGQGLPPHREPEDLPEEDCVSWDMGGYHPLHTLRQVAAYCWARRKLAASDDDNPADDPVVVDYYQRGGLRRPAFWQEVFCVQDRRPPRFGHLMFHQDNDGLYIPIDFKRVLFSPEHSDALGGAVGSSMRLRAECEVLARRLQLPLDLDPEADAVVQALEQPGDDGGQLWRRHAVASFVCLCFHRACEASIRTGAAIVFG